MTNVKSYTDKQILDRVKSVGGKIRAGKYLLVGVQSVEDATDLFDDKFYIFDGGHFVMVTSGTTNPGLTVLKHFAEKDLPGALVWKTNMFYKDLFEPGYHRGRMKALRQVAPIKFYRDKDKDGKCEEQGELHEGNQNCNQHGVSYDPFSKKIGTKIGGWSYGCQVMNVMSDYRHWINAAWERNKKVDYCLLKEW